MALINGILTCDNECNHGCNVRVHFGQNWINAALDAGWVVQLWKTPSHWSHEHELVGMPAHASTAHVHQHDDRGNDNHALAYCDALCAFTGLRQKLLLQADYAERIAQLEQPA